MPTEIDTLIDESLKLRSQIQQQQEQYDSKRKRILEIMIAADQKFYRYGPCKAVRSDPISIETVSKELLIQALKEVDIPREKNVFIWNRAIREVQRQAMVTLQVPGGKKQPLNYE
jgi:uncharacterized protein YpmB